MEKEVVLRIKSNKGFQRVTMKYGDSLGQLKQKIADLTQYPPNSFILYFNDKFGKTLNALDHTKLYSFPDIQDGQILWVELLGGLKDIQVNSNQQVQQIQQGQTQQHLMTFNCNHPPHAYCINCSKLKEQNQTSNKQKEEEQQINKCTHGPKGKCLNCSPVEKKNEQKEKQEIQKWLCQHGPQGKCTNCVDSEFISNVKHISFDQYLNHKKMNCQHPSDAKCSNCIPPSAMSYIVKRDCKNHLPFPKAMCNSCMPQSIIINKRQEYRHVDYAQFMNFTEIQNFVISWEKTQRTVQKMGFLYGYYAEDPNFKDGVRAIIEAVYEPPQIGDISGFEMIEDPNEKIIDQIAEFLKLEKIGWIFTDINQDTFLDSKAIRQAAHFQQQYSSIHPTGYRVSKFLTVVLRPDQNDPVGNVVPSVYMVSDQAQAIERDGVFGESDRRRHMILRKPVDENDIIPTLIRSGKQVTEIEPDFFIVNISYGAPKTNKFNILKHYDFPRCNRKDSSQDQNKLKSYLKKYEKQPSYEKYADFHLLIYLAQLIDIDTVCNIASSVEQEQQISPQTEELIKVYCGY